MITPSVFGGVLIFINATHRAIGGIDEGKSRLKSQSYSFSITSPTQGGYAEAIIIWFVFSFFAAPAAFVDSGAFSPPFSGGKLPFALVLPLSNGEALSRETFLQKGVPPLPMRHSRNRTAGQTTASLRSLCILVTVPGLPLAGEAIGSAVGYCLRRVPARRLSPALPKPGQPSCGSQPNRFHLCLVLASLASYCKNRQPNTATVPDVAASGQSSAGWRPGSSINGLCMGDYTNHII